MGPSRLILVSALLVLVLFVLPAGADSSVMSIAPAPADTSGPPPHNLSYYLDESKAAVAGQNWSYALVVSTRGTKWFPGNGELFCLNGYAYRKVGQYDKAVSAVSAGIRLDPEPIRYANRGYAYLARNNNSAALADAESGIALNASYATDYTLKALALQGMGKNAEALDAVSTALRLAPDSAHSWHVKGRILAASGDCAGAREALEKSLALDDGYSLPYPGFGSAADNLTALNGACAPAAAVPAPAVPTTKQSPPGWAVVAGIAGAAMAFAVRK